jgi:NAD(P)-dependent dehydrogenase (short-subunit alcohol dehydrogenase family)
MELKDRVAIITGGGTGMGKATAALFAAEGAKVVIAGRREAPLRQTVDEITKAGGAIMFVKTDVTDTKQVQALIAKTVKKFGRIDILFNNAGVFISGKETQDFTEEEWDRTMDANFRGTLLCSRYAVPHMKLTGGGVIINCTSVSGKMAQRMQTPYNVSKAAVEMMSKCMALELGQYSIRVNTICPSLTDTDMAAGHFAAHGREFFAKMHPIQRVGSPMDVAWAALYLASEKASWVTGNSLYVDGGYATH